MFGLVALVGVAGCGDDEDDDDAVSASDLEGRAFLATETEGFTMVAGSEITISFTEDMLSVETGCNNVTGSYTIENDVLTPGELAQTLIACDAELTAQEQWIKRPAGIEPVDRARRQRARVVERRELDHLRRNRLTGRAVSRRSARSARAGARRRPPRTDW